MCGGNLLHEAWTPRKDHRSLSHNSKTVCGAKRLTKEEFNLLTQDSNRPPLVREFKGQRPCTVGK